MKLLLDENLSPRHARTLRGLGHDCVSVVELGLSGAEDPDVGIEAVEEAWKKRLMSREFGLNKN